MNTYAMGIAMNTAALSQTAAHATQSDAPEAGFSFAQILSSLQAGGPGQANAQADGQAQNLTWRDIQAGMMQDAIQTLQNAERPVATNPVMAQLLELLKSLSGEDGGEANLQELLAMIKNLQQELLELVQKNGGEMAGQQLLAALSQLMQQAGGLPLAENALRDLSAEGAEPLLDTLLNSSPEQILELLQSEGRAQTPQAAASGFEAALTQQTAPQAADQQPAVQTTPPAMDAALATAEAEIATGSAVQQPAAGFEAAVQAAKQAMQPKQAEETAQARPPEDDGPDIDALQQRVDAGIYLQNTALANGATEAKAIQPPPPPVETQLYQGITTALASGQQELTLKLMPEGLGEVTVRLLATEQGMRLSLVTQNADTQRLLAGELQQLQQSLKPLQVEVEEILTQRQYDLLSQQQQFGGQRHQNHQPMRGAAYYGSTPAAEGEANAPTAPIAMQTAPNTVLNAYI